MRLVILVYHPEYFFHTRTDEVAMKMDKSLSYAVG
jgi:hypothetical protein